MKMKIGYITLCLIAALIPLFRFSQSSPFVITAPAARTLTNFNGSPLEEMELDPREKKFYAGFPGQVNKYHLTRQPGQYLIVRYITAPDRRLHPAVECYRGQGWKCDFRQPRTTDVAELPGKDAQWSCFTAQGETSATVMETTISFSRGKSYPDVSAWFWQTTFSRDDPGPWLNVVWVQ